MIRVLVVDDEALVRAGLCMIMQAAGDIEVVGEAADGEQAVRVAARERPDVVLLDVRMPRADGLAALRRIAAAADPPRVLMLTTFDLDEYVHEALRAGAAGFLLKDTPPRELMAAVRAVVAGRAVLAPTVTRRLIDDFVGRDPSAVDAARRRLALLTPREREVAGAVGRGLGNAEVARELGSTGTAVKAHVSRALTKLGLANRVQLALLVRDAALDERRRL